MGRSLRTWPCYCRSLVRRLRPVIARRFSRPFGRPWSLSLGAAPPCCFWMIFNGRTMPRRSYWVHWRVRWTPNHWCCLARSEAMSCRVGMRSGGCAASCVARAGCARSRSNRSVPSRAPHSWSRHWGWSRRHYAEKSSTERTEFPSSYVSWVRHWQRAAVWYRAPPGWSCSRVRIFRCRTESVTLCCCGRLACPTRLAMPSAPPPWPARCLILSWSWQLPDCRSGPTS